MLPSYRNQYTSTYVEKQEKHFTIQHHFLFFMLLENKKNFESLLYFHSILYAMFYHILSK